MTTNLTIKISVWLDFIFTCPLLAYRLLRFGYTYRRIYLGEGIWTILDPEDYCRLRNYKWVVHGTGNNLYAVRHKLVSPNKTWLIYMHREILISTDGRFVDHRNCDSLDNRKSNLRFATRAENIRNSRKRKNTTSQFIGVNFYKRDSNWECRIMHDGKRILIGRFVNEIDAAHAYDEAVLSDLALQDLWVGVEQLPYTFQSSTLHKVL